MVASGPPTFLPATGGATTTGATGTTAPPIVTASAGIDPAVVERLTEQIVELVAATEEVRGLRFLTQPNVAILTPEELAERVREDLVGFQVGRGCGRGRARSIGARGQRNAGGEREYESARAHAGLRS